MKRGLRLIFIPLMAALFTLAAVIHAQVNTTPLALDKPQHLVFTTDSQETAERLVASLRDIDTTAAVVVSPKRAPNGRITTVQSGSLPLNNVIEIERRFTGTPRASAVAGKWIRISVIYTEANVAKVKSVLSTVNTRTFRLQSGELGRNMIVSPVN